MIDFLLVSKNWKSVDEIKEKLNNKYKVKDSGEVKRIIRWQVTHDLKTKILNIDQLAFIQDLIAKKKLSNCNFINIPMKVDSFIDIQEEDNYNEINLKIY